MVWCLGTHWAWRKYPNYALILIPLLSHQIPGSLFPGKLFNEMFLLDSLWWDTTSRDRFIIPHN